MAKSKTAPKSAGARGAKITAYYGYRYAHNKLGRILRRNGEREAKRWADNNQKFSGTQVLAALLKMNRRVVKPKERRDEAND